MLMKICCSPEVAFWFGGDASQSVPQSNTLSFIITLNHTETIMRAIWLRDSRLSGCQLGRQNYNIRSDLLSQNSVYLLIFCWKIWNEFEYIRKFKINKNVCVCVCERDEIERERMTRTCSLSPDRWRIPFGGERRETRRGTRRGRVTHASSNGLTEGQ